MAGSHTTLGCELIQTGTPGSGNFVGGTLLLSHCWVNNLCDGSELFMDELQAWCKTTVLSIGGYLKTTMDFVSKVELLALR